MNAYLSDNNVNEYIHCKQNTMSTTDIYATSNLISHYKSEEGIE